MKIKNIAGWNYTPQMEALLFFASLIDEMTFNYTLDSFKASVHNAFSLMRECLETIEDIDDDTIMKGSLPPITEEIKDALLNDIVLREIMPAHGLDFVEKKIDGNTRRNELKLVLEMFLTDSVIHQYNERVKNELTGLIKNNSNHKTDIERLSRLFVAQMKYLGYPNASIYKKNKDFFFGRTANIQNVDALDDFFALFDTKLQEYTVCLFGNHLYDYLTAALQPVQITVSNAFNIVAWNPNYAGIGSSMDPKSRYITIPVKAMDEYHALLQSINKLTHFTSLFSFYHHKDRFNFVRDEGIVRRNIDGANWKIPIPQSPMLACEDERPANAATIYQQVIGMITLESDSFERFTKSVRLHDASIRSSHEENQFLNLFTSLEVLIPKATDSGSNRITQISDTMIPYLCQIHFQRIAASFGQDLKLWNPTLYSSTLAQIAEGNSDDEKLCALICLAKYDPQRSQIMADATAANYTHLRYRLWKLNARMGTVEKVKSTFFRFEQRMRWHINRLYRTRNLIVHAGAHPDYLDMLLENIHSFYDIFMRGLLTDITTRKMLKLEYSYIIRRQRYEKYTLYLNSLKNTDTIDENNYLKVLGLS